MNGQCRVAAVVVFVLSASLYANTLQNGFLMDDHYNVVENAQIRDFSKLTFFRPLAADSKSTYNRKLNQAYWRPLTAVSYAVDYKLWRLNPLGYHLTNALLHALVSVLVLLSAVRLVQNFGAGKRVVSERPSPPSAPLGRLSFARPKSMRIGLVAGVLFAAHPVHTEVVNLITYRTELLAALFVVCALLLRSASSWRRWHVPLVAVIYACGLASKETAVTLPALIVLLDLALGRIKRRNIRELVLTYGGLFAVFAGYLLLRAKALHSPSVDFFGGIAWPLRALSMAKIYALYVKLLLAPWPLLSFYDWTAMPPAVSLFDWEAYVGLFLLLITLGLGWGLRRRAPLAALGIAWWLVGLIPFLHVIPLPVGAAERFLYLPSIGICLAFAVGVVWVVERVGRPALISVTVMLIAAGSAVVIRNTHWRSDMTLQTQAVRDFPHCFIAHHNLGLLQKRAGALDQAVASLTRANTILPNVVANVVPLAEMLIALGEGDRARHVLDAAIAELGPLNVLVNLRQRATL